MFTSFVRSGVPTLQPCFQECCFAAGTSVADMHGKTLGEAPLTWAQAVMIGDSLAADMQGGQNAGLAATVWVNRSGAARPPQARLCGPGVAAVCGAGLAVGVWVLCAREDYMLAIGTAMWALGHTNAGFSQPQAAQPPRSAEPQSRSSISWMDTGQ